MLRLEPPAAGNRPAVCSRYGQHAVSCINLSACLRSRQSSGEKEPYRRDCLGNGRGFVRAFVPVFAGSRV